VDDVVKNNNFPKYIDVRIAQFNKQIADLNDNIAIQEKAIIDNPAQEENINQIIEDLKKQIKMIETNNIPILEYRLAKNIVPGEEIWQNAAISDVENNRSQLVYTTIMTEEQFKKDPGYIQQYGSYQKYVDKTQKTINELNNKILIAQHSLDADKPDMKYVNNGSRTKTVEFLDYSIYVALFGVLLGGWLIASEFQQGTVRLLMIRPRTRVKILLAKFIAAFAVTLAIYFAGSILNFITNGICFGFSDFAYPNYTIAGETNFFVYYLPKLLMCIVPMFFGFSVAFMLSTVVKNSAVSIAVPIVLFVGCFFSMIYSAFRTSMEWIAYTPVPFVQLSSFFVPNSIVQQAMQNGVSFSLPYGIGMLLALSAVCMFVSVIVFKKRDITN
jgi:ABC-2 type transport system permease protein